MRARTKISALGASTAPLAATAVLVGAAVTAVPASAGVPAKLRAEYTFESLSDSTVADVTGAGHDLALKGSYRETEGPVNRAVAFDPISRGATADHEDLNPGGREFGVTVVFRLPADTSTLPDTPNMAQKGTFGDAGQWKMQLKPGPASVQCRFKGTTGASLLTSAVKDVDDGAWHSATCWRSGTSVGVIVDGTETTTTAPTGIIANSRRMLLGNKTLRSSTDQFPGEIGYVAIATGDGAAAASQAGAPPL
jgi:hypothetical protein